MPTATPTSKGRITLPRAIRERLRLSAGDRVDFLIRDDGTIVVRAATGDVRNLRGLLRRKGARTLAVEEMDAVIRRQATAARSPRAPASAGTTPRRARS